MSKYFLTLICLFTIISLSQGQNVYYGIPLDSTTLVKGDVIIVNNPRHSNGRFMKSNQLDNIIDFIVDHPLQKFRIEVNISHGSQEFNKAYSEKLSKALEYLIVENKGMNNCSFRPNGSLNPLIKEGDNNQYRIYNSRTEIILE